MQLRALVYTDTNCADEIVMDVVKQDLIEFVTSLDPRFTTCESCAQPLPVVEKTIKMLVTGINDASLERFVYTWVEPTTQTYLAFVWAELN